VRRHIPNALSALRLLLAPPLALALCRPSLEAAVAALGLALLVELTDGLDGLLARRYGWQSALGRFLDPLADSVARLTAFVALHSADRLLPLWMLLCLLWRDQLVAYLRVDAARRGLDVGARSSGKIKAAAQAAAIVLVCAGRVAAHPELGWIQRATLELWSFRLMAVATAATLASAWDYVQGLWRNPR
jgi:CDP-diacylglycerol--glycerol-3-phosphate 3-phosphatidyltransferase